MGQRAFTGIGIPVKDYSVLTGNHHLGGLSMYLLDRMYTVSEENSITQNLPFAMLPFSICSGDDTSPCWSCRY